MKNSLAKTAIKTAAALGLSFVVASCVTSKQEPENENQAPDANAPYKSISTPPFINTENSSNKKSDQDENKKTPELNHLGMG